MLKVTCYRSSKMESTNVYMVKRIEAMPGPDEIMPEDREFADGIMLHLFLNSSTTFTNTDGTKTVLFDDMFIPHSFLISIEEV